LISGGGVLLDAVVVVVAKARVGFLAKRERGLPVVLDRSKLKAWQLRAYVILLLLLLLLRDDNK
jgi:hypothetical protein